MYLRYAKSYLPLAIPLTIISWSLVYANGPRAITAVLFLKVITVLIGIVTLRKRHRFDIFFYQNVGYGEWRLLTVVGTVDLLIWLVGIIVLISTMS